MNKHTMILLAVAILMTIGLFYYNSTVYKCAYGLIIVLLLLSIFKPVEKFSLHVAN